MEQIFIDEETGESIVCSLLTCGTKQREKVTDIPPVNNAETGEPEITVEVGVQRRRVPFQIPRKVKEEISLNQKETMRNKNEGFIDVEPVSGASFAQTNPIFLCLIAIVYFRWILALLMSFEVGFHIWTHHKNKRLKDTNVFFRSPFHGITSEFCALCQNENCMDKVGKMQEIRMYKFLRQCNYMKRAVT